MTSFQARLPASQIDDTYPCSSPNRPGHLAQARAHSQSGIGGQDGIRHSTAQPRVRSRKWWVADVSRSSASNGTAQRDGVWHDTILLERRSPVR